MGRWRASRSTRALRGRRPRFNAIQPAHGREWCISWPVTSLGNPQIMYTGKYIFLIFLLLCSLFMWLGNVWLWIDCSTLEQVIHSWRTSDYLYRFSMFEGVDKSSVCQGNLVLGPGGLLGFQCKKILGDSGTCQVFMRQSPSVHWFCCWNDLRQSLRCRGVMRWWRWSLWPKNSPVMCPG